MTPLTQYLAYNFELQNSGAWQSQFFKATGNEKYGDT